MLKVIKKEKHPVRRQLAALLPASLFCVLSAVYWELLIYRITQRNSGMPGIWILIFTPAIGAVVSTFSGITENRKANLWILDAALLVPAVFYIADAMYYFTFGSLFSVSMLGMGGAAITDFGWAAVSVVLRHIWIIFLFLLPCLIPAAYVIIKKDGIRRIGGIARASVLAAGAALWIAAVCILPLGGKADHTAYGAYHSRFVDTDTASAKIGALPNFIVETRSMFISSTDSADIEGAEEVVLDEDGIQTPAPQTDTSPNRIAAINFGSLAEIADNDKIKNICRYLATEKGTDRNEYTGLLEGYNLIYICAESFSSLAVRKEVTPTLYKLANEGIILTNYYNSFKNTTTNGEYALLTGLWADVSREASMGSNVGSMAQSARRYMPTALGNMMNGALGIQSLGYHNFKGGYYYRNESLPNFGFKCKFMNDGMKFTTSWPSSDLEMMEQSVDDYIDSDGPFTAYYMTFSGHGTYTTENPIVEKNLDTVQELIGSGSGLSDYAKGYLAAQYELDRALDYLLTRLEEAGKLENTLIVLAGDHYPYYLSDRYRDQLAGHETDTEFEIYKSTCIMWTAGLERNIVTDVPCCSVDVLPTVLNLMGIEYDSRLYSGIDIFSSAEHRAVLYNRNFITDKVIYNNSTGEAVWLIDTSGYTEEQLQAYLDSNIAVVKSRYQAAVNMGDTDFFRFVYEKSGLAG